LEFNALKPPAYSFSRCDSSDFLPIMPEAQCGKLRKVPGREKRCNCRNLNTLETLARKNAQKKQGIEELYYEWSRIMYINKQKVSSKE
jgi:hypothetical protein